MTGSILALTAALSWAVSSTILKFLTARIDTILLNTVRLCVTSLLLLAFILLSGRGDELANTPFRSLAFLMASGIVALAVGDTVYIKSLSYLNVSQAFPIAQCANPVVTMTLAILLLGERVTWVTGLGTLFVLAGIYLITRKPLASRLKTTDVISVKGIMLALTAGVGWAIAAVTIKLGAVNQDPIVAAAIRISTAAVVLLVFNLSRKQNAATQLKSFSSRSLLLTIASGIIDYGVGIVVFIVAIQLIGAGKTVVLVATSPLLLLPFSILILKEKVTRLTLAGIVSGIAGIVLVSL